MTGRANGPSHLDVVMELRKVGYEVLQVWEKPPYLPGANLWRFFRQVSLTELALFTRELSLFFSAGIGLVRGLECIQEQGFSKQTGAAAKDVSKALNGGASLSQSMSLRPDVFPPLYVRLVNAGEVSGALDRLLARLSDYLERELLLRKQVQSSLAYPAIIFLVCVGLCAFLVFFLFPTFVEFFDGLDMRLPAITTSLISLTQLFREPAFVLVLVLAPFASLKLLDWMRRSEATVLWWSQWMLNLPLVGPLQRSVILARFCSTLAILLNAGIPQFSALNYTADALGSKAATKAVERAAERIRDDGDSLSEALSKEELFPKMLVSLILVGEEVGRVAEVLEMANGNFEMDIESRISRLTVLLEPIMLSIMGLIVGYVLLAVFLPIYSMLDAL